MKDNRPDLSYGDLFLYQNCVEGVSNLARDIIEETEYYSTECGMLVCDADTFADNIRIKMRQMEQNLREMERMRQEFYYLWE